MTASVTSRASVRLLMASALVFVLATAGALGDPATTISAPRSGHGRATMRMLDLASIVASSAPLRPLLDVLGSANTINTGNDGRLTVLLLGSDSRNNALGRTDSIMIMSLKNNTINAASIPRDTARVPNPYQGGTYTGRINSLLAKLRSGTTVNAGLARMEFVIEKWLQIEIDYHALLRFDSFSNLVDEVEPIPIGIGREIRDPKHIDDRNKPRGVYFPARNNYSLYARPLCNGNWRFQSNPIPSQYWCRRALPFVRSRKGPGNNDWIRSRRQQDFVGAAIDRVIGRGTGSPLSGLVSTAIRERNAARLYTNVPLTSSDAVSLYNRLRFANLGTQVVFKPKTWAKRVSGSSAYELKLPAVRQWTATYMK